jgi:hypothetical protein
VLPEQKDRHEEPGGCDGRGMGTQDQPQGCTRGLAFMKNTEAKEKTHKVPFNIHFCP